MKRFLVIVCVLCWLPVLVYGFVEARRVVLRHEARARQAAKKAAPKKAAAPQKKAPAQKKAAPQKKRLALRGVRGGSQQRQNQQANREGLTRIADQKEFEKFVTTGLLVPIVENDSIEIDDDLNANRRYSRPWTKAFLLNFARSYKAKFGKKLKVTSAVRTMEDQAALRRRNGNASRTSTHPTGSTLDISWKGMTQEELVWMNSTLIALRSAGKLEAVREIRQACFHVMVFNKYVQAPPIKKAPAKKASPSKKGGNK